VHVTEFGGSGRPIILVHGLGGSALNWLAVGSSLARHGRVVAIDLAGFGRTAPGGRRSTVPANHELLHRFLETNVAAPALLIGNSMGGLIAMMEASTAPERVAGLVLAAPAQPAPRGTRVDREVFAAFALYSIPWLAGWYMHRRAERLGPEGLVREMLRLCCVDPARVAPEVRQAHVALAAERMARMPWATAAFLDAARSILTELRRRRGFEEMVGGIRAPTLLIQGTHDRLVPRAASETLARRRPDWTFELYEQVGHVPQLETPQRFTDSVARWLDGPGRGLGARV